jgi:hypothetical protein
MRLRAMLAEDREVGRSLRAIGQPTELRKQEPSRGPPFWKSRALRCRVLADEATKAIPGTGIVAGAACVCRSGAKRRAA